MTTPLVMQVHQILAHHFHIPSEQITQPGTSFYPNEARNDLIVLWSVGERVVVDTAPTQLEEIQALLTKFPPHHRLTAADVKQIWESREQDANKMYALDIQTFRPFIPDSRYIVRQLTTQDQAAFEAFLAQCSEADIEEGDVSIDHLSAFGVFDGNRLAAVASAYEWLGLIDIGILTDPAYRGKGLGKAAVSACSLYQHKTGDKAVVYRHDVENLGSQGIAQGLNFTYYGLVEALNIAS